MHHRLFIALIRLYQQAATKPRHDRDAALIIEEYKLPFPLVADTDGAVARPFHVPIRQRRRAWQVALKLADMGAIDDHLGLFPAAGPCPLRRRTLATFVASARIRSALFGLASEPSHDTLGQHRGQGMEIRR